MARLLCNLPVKASFNSQGSGLRLSLHCVPTEEWVKKGGKKVPVLMFSQARLQFFLERFRPLQSMMGEKGVGGGLGGVWVICHCESAQFSAAMSGTHHQLSKNNKPHQPNFPDN